MMRQDARLARLDETDRRILAELTNDVRITNADLARAVGLSASACLERVRRLREDGIIRGGRAIIDPAAFGIGIEALVAVELRRHTRAAVKSFRESAEALREVVAIYHVTGADDFLLHVVARDPDHLRDLTLDEFTQIREVAHIRTSLVFERIEKPGWPDLT